MLAASQLDDDPCFQANEVTNIGPERPLAPELEVTHLSTSQATPEEPFGIGCVLAQGAGEAIHPLIRSAIVGDNMAYYTIFECMTPSAPAGHLP